MRAIILCALLMLYIPVNCQSIWDNDMCDYTNHTWNFHWNLESDLDWEYHQGNEKHTVFRAISPYGIMVFINIAPFETRDQKNINLWNDFDKFKQVLEYSWEKVAERTGGITTPLKVEKCRFFGEQAIKVLVKTEIHDDVNNEISYGLTYTFHKDNATWSASVKVSSDVWEIAGESGLKKLFKELGPNAKCD